MKLIYSDEDRDLLIDKNPVFRASVGIDLPCNIYNRGKITVNYYLNGRFSPSTSVELSNTEPTSKQTS